MCRERGTHHLGRRACETTVSSRHFVWNHFTLVLRCDALAIMWNEAGGSWCDEILAPRGAAAPELYLVACDGMVDGFARTYFVYRRPRVN